MLYKFIEGIYKNISYFNSTTLISIVLIFIGTVIAGFSEEIMFRGMLLNTLKGKIHLISAMIISSLGFSPPPQHRNGVLYCLRAGYRR